MFVAKSLKSLYVFRDNIYLCTGKELSVISNASFEKSLCRLLTGKPGPLRSGFLLDMIGMSIAIYNGITNLSKLSEPSFTVVA